MKPKNARSITSSPSPPPSSLLPFSPPPSFLLLLPLSLFVRGLLLGDDRILGGTGPRRAMAATGVGCGRNVLRRRGEAGVRALEQFAVRLRGDLHRLVDRQTRPRPGRIEPPGSVKTRRVDRTLTRRSSGWIHGELPVGRSGTRDRTRVPLQRAEVVELRRSGTLPRRSGRPSGCPRRPSGGAIVVDRIGKMK